MPFDFKQFSIDDSACAMKVGTDGVLLGAWAALPASGVIVDIGTGSGLIALMIAQRAGASVSITGIESDPDAAKCAYANVKSSKWHEAVTIKHADFAEYEPPTPPSLIISNPPFFTSGMLPPGLARTKSRHCNGPLTPMSLIGYADKHLAVSGSLAMITPTDMEQAIIFEATMRHMSVVRRCDVTTVPHKKPRRILWQIQRHKDTPGAIAEHTRLSIRDCNGTFSDEYKSLTAPFYLDF